MKKIPYNSLHKLKACHSFICNQLFLIKIDNFKVIYKLIRLPVYMDELIAIPMTKRQQSITEVVKEYGKRLFGFIRSRVSNNDDAEDILQEVWYALSSVIDTERIEQMSSWLFRVSRNRIVDKKRKQSTLSLEDMAYEDEDGEMVFPEALFIDSTAAETEIDWVQFKEALYKALNELPEKQQEVFVLNELEGMTLQQIADKTGESIKTIISRKHYAVIYLRERLRKMYKNINL
jgi:RNA polymerase sigma factor (sigma-70 family)